MRWLRAPALMAMALVISAFAAGGQGGDAMLANEADGANWPLYGRTFSANHYSPLDQINDANVGRLGLLWSLDLTTLGSLYTSPIAVDGVIYFAQGYSVIHAVDARTGKLKWKYDPEAGKAAGTKLVAAWGARGIAWWDGKVYTGTQDGRLIAIDAKSGKPVWSVQTTEGPDDGRYITGAPWVFRGKVIIGHGGADFSPVRGYVTAYDARTGRKAWRFYTVPGDPAKGPDGEASDEVMAKAAKTWTGEWWRFGGGGTVWNAMAYDPKFNRIYIGTGNGFPWNQKIRSPGGGDNLFLCAIVALDADTGRYVWHYQVNPGETWDYNAAMDIELTHLTIGGRTRPVILHAPKNGFYYVIDRETGKPLSAEPYVTQNWAKRIDLATGRPEENPQARYPDERGALVTPGSSGGHTALAMSHNPVTGLTYIPAQEAPRFYSDAGIDRATWKPAAAGMFTPHVGLSAAPPPTPTPPRKPFLMAWNPLTHSRIWSAPMPPGENGGIMSTGGRLVFSGQADGLIKAYSAATGQVLWSFDAQTGVSSQAITYLVDGKQYVTVVAGYRGLSEPSPWDYRTQPRRVLTFALDGQAKLPPKAVHAKRFVDDPAAGVDPAKAALGQTLFSYRRCRSCHGLDAVGSGVAPDLRESSISLSKDAFFAVVHDGALQGRGMPGFKDLSATDVEAIRHYVRGKARQALAEQTTAGPR